MLYIVEVAIEAGKLAHKLGQMRTWLDHMQYQAMGFRQIPGTNVCRVYFEGEQEAKAFANAFAGQVLNRTAAYAGGEPCMPPRTGTRGQAELDLMQLRLFPGLCR